jgi:hypothetical protein
MQLAVLLSVVLFAIQVYGALNPPYPGEGSILCGEPLYDKNGKFTGRRTCANVDATKLGKRPNTWDTPLNPPANSYSFWDSQRWEIWSCPRDYARWVTPVNSETACRKHIGLIANWKRAHAIKVQKMAQCPAGSFYDLWEGGENGYPRMPAGACWKCPASSSKRTIFHIKDGWACERGFLGEGKSPAILVTPRCPADTFFDSYDNSCYKCPETYERSGDHITSSSACWRTGDYKPAQLLNENTCNHPGAILDLSRTVQLGVNCFRCPDLSSDGGFVASTGCAYDLINWKVKKLPPPGMFNMDGFEDALRDLLRNRPWELDFILRGLSAETATGEATAPAEAYVRAWDMMRQPQYSPILRVYFWQLFTEIINSPNPPPRGSIQARILKSFGQYYKQYSLKFVQQLKNYHYYFTEACKQRMGKLTAQNVWDIGCDPKWTNDNAWLKTRMLDLTDEPIVNAIFLDTYDNTTGKSNFGSPKAITQNQRIAIQAIAMSLPAWLIPTTAWKSLPGLSKIFPYSSRAFFKGNYDDWQEAGSKLVTKAENVVKQADNLDDAARLAGGLRNTKAVSEAVDVAKSAQVAGKSLKKVGDAVKAAFRAVAKSIQKFAVFLARMILRSIPFLQVIDIILMAIDIFTAGGQIVGAQGNAEGMLNQKLDEATNGVFDHAYFKRQFDVFNNQMEIQNFFLHAMAGLDDLKDTAWWENRYARVRTLYGNDFTRTYPDGTLPLFGGPPARPSSVPPSGFVIGGIGGGSLGYLDTPVITPEVNNPPLPPIVTINTPGLVNGVVISNAQGGAALDWSVSIVDGNVGGTTVTCFDVSTKQRIYFGQPKGSSPPEPPLPAVSTPQGFTLLTFTTVTLNICFQTCPGPDATVFAVGKQHTIQCEAVNPAGGRGFQQERFTVLDTTPPVVNLIQGAIQAINPSGMYKLVFEAWDETTDSQFRDFTCFLMANNFRKLSDITLKMGATAARREATVALASNNIIRCNVQDVAGNVRRAVLTARVSRIPTLTFSGLPASLPYSVEAERNNVARVSWTMTVNDDGAPPTPQCFWSIGSWTQERSYGGAAQISTRAVSPMGFVQSGRMFPVSQRGFAHGPAVQNNLLNMSIVPLLMNLDLVLGKRFLSEWWTTLLPSGFLKHWSPE